MMWGYGYGYPMMGYGFGLVGAIFGILWAILIITFIMWVIRRMHGSSHGYGRRFFEGSSALDILKERYAKGEIDKAEFEEKKKDLSA